MGKSERVDALLSRHNDLESLIEDEEKKSHPDVREFKENYF